MKKLPLLFIALILLGSCSRAVLEPSSAISIETPRGEEVLIDNNPLTAEEQRQAIRAMSGNKILYKKLLSDNKWAFAGVWRNKAPISITVGDTIIGTGYEPAENFMQTISGTTEGIVKTISFSSPEEIMAWEDYDDLEKTYVIKYLTDLKKLPREEKRYWEKAYWKEERKEGKRQLDMSLRKGRFHITAGIPLLNFMSYVPPSIAYRDRLGAAFGINAGVDYHYSNRSSIATGVEFIGVKMRSEKTRPEHTRVSQISLSLTNNTHIGRRISLGYGLNASFNKWRYTYNFGPEYLEKHPDEADFVPRIPLGKSTLDKYWALGFNFNLFVKLNPAARVGLVYRPTVWRPGLKTTTRYEHSVGIEMKCFINPRKNSY